VRARLGDRSGAVTDLQHSIGSLERSKLWRYLLMGSEMLATVLLEQELNQQALEASQRALALADSTGITFWRVRIEATNAIVRMRLGDLGVGSALTAALTWARENDERSQMVRCLEGLAELAFRRGELDACRRHAEEIVALAEAAKMQELATLGRSWLDRARDA
jgi:hypothetical protein